MGAVRQGLQCVFEEVSSDLPRHLPVQLCMNKLGGSIHGDEQVGLALAGADFTDIDVQVANRVTLERLLLAFLAASLGKLTDPVSLIKPMQARSGKRRDLSLKRMKAVIERQQGLLPEGDGRSFLQGRQRRGASRLGPMRVSSTLSRLRHLRTVFGLMP